MTNADLKTALLDARGITSAVWLGVHTLNEQSGQTNEMYRQLVTLTSAAVDTIARAVRLLEEDV